MKRLFSLLVFLLIVFLIEWIGHRLTSSSVGDWYLTIAKPSWNPPSWVFAPVWTVLYATVAVSGWLIFIKVRDCPKKYVGFVIYGLQLLCNALWSYFFFFMKNPGFALVDILILVFFITVSIICFFRLYYPAAVLLIPYWIWTLYAAVLNAAIFSLNR